MNLMRQTNSAMARELVRFSLPLILSGILQQLYSWADAFIVGHSGPEGERMLAAVGATGTLTGFIINLLMGFTLGLSILAAQEFGRGNRDKIRGIMSCYLPLFFIVIAIITGVASFLVEPILRLMSTPAEIFTYAGSYLRLILIGVPVLAVYNLVAARFCYRRHRKQQSRPDAAVSASSSEK
ncbi:MAG: hypothetical protein K5707_09065 [Clostridia bacterium]|nr:hypothetical protein [Clostridia bacterium]